MIPLANWGFCSTSDTSLSNCCFILTTLLFKKIIKIIVHISYFVKKNFKNLHFYKFLHNSIWKRKQIVFDKKVDTQWHFRQYYQIVIRIWYSLTIEDRISNTSHYRALYFPLHIVRLRLKILLTIFLFFAHASHNTVTFLSCSLCADVWLSLAPCLKSTNKDKLISLVFSCMLRPRLKLGIRSNKFQR